MSWTFATLPTGEHDAYQEFQKGDRSFVILLRVFGFDDEESRRQLDLMIHCFNLEQYKELI